ncbi:MAG: hypothetical protein GW780_04340 [Candidatus Aenigmarchaeota archaeon]|nr:hypothetical protein [Candidatus Aenigmarchaeota archaeon]
MDRLLIALFIVLLIVTPILSQEEVQTQARIKSIGSLSKGIAVSPDNPLEFRMVKAGVARAIVATGAEEKEFNVGVFVMDEVKYRLKNVVIEEGKLAADIYSISGDKVSDQPVGSLSLTSFMNQDMKMEVWAGTLDLSGTFNLYMVEAPRSIQPLELNEKVKDYCSENPENEKCKQRAGDYCKNNPDDEKCKELFRDYCQDNMDDTRCRNALKDWCNDNQNSEKCREFIVTTTKEFCKENLNSEKCVKIKKAIQNFDTIAKKVEERRVAINAVKNQNQDSNIVKERVNQGQKTTTTQIATETTVPTETTVNANPDVVDGANNPNEGQNAGAGV